MSSDVVVLSGPPATGKDRISREMEALDPDFVLFRKLKSGTGRTGGYRMISPEALLQLDEAGELIQRNARYSNTYAVDRGELLRIIESGGRPLIHAGRATDAERLIRALRDRCDVCSVLLLANRDAVRSRLIARGATDVEPRLDALDEELQILRTSDFPSLFNLVLRTDRRSPTELAAEIAAVANAPMPPIVDDEQLRRMVTELSAR